MIGLAVERIVSRAAARRTGRDEPVRARADDGRGVAIAAFVLLRHIRADLSGRPARRRVCSAGAGDVAVGMGIAARRVGRCGRGRRSPAGWGTARSGSAQANRRRGSGRAAADEPARVHGAPQPGFEPVPGWRRARWPSTWRAALGAASDGGLDPVGALLPRRAVPRRLASAGAVREPAATGPRSSEGRRAGGRSTRESSPVGLHPEVGAIRDRPSTSIGAADRRDGLPRPVATAPEPRRRRATTPTTTPPPRRATDYRRSHHRSLSQERTTTDDLADRTASRLRRRDGRLPSRRHGPRALAAFTADHPRQPRRCPTPGWAGWPAATTTVDTLAGAHQNSRALYRETRRIGLNDGDLYAQITAPLYLTVPVWSRATIGLAYASALIAAAPLRRRRRRCSTTTIITADTQAAQCASVHHRGAVPPDPPLARRARGHRGVSAAPTPPTCWTR